MQTRETFDLSKGEVGSETLTALANGTLHSDHDCSSLSINDRRSITPGIGNRINSDANDNEQLRALIQNCIGDEVRPLVAKIDELQKEIIEGETKIISLEQKIEKLTKQNKLLPKVVDKVDLTDNSSASTSYASAAQNNKKSAVIVIKPVQDEAKTTNDENKKVESLNSVKSSINVKELCVGVTSVRERER